MLSTRTNVKCSRRDRFVGLCFFHADFGELGELRRVLRSECRGHVLHQNDGSREVACETGSDAHDRCRSARGSRQNDHRKALVTRGRRRARTGLCSCGRLCTPTRALNRGSQTRSEEHTSELQSHSDLVCRLLLEKKKDPAAVVTVTIVENDNVS